MTESRCATHVTQLAPWSCVGCGLRCVKCVARVKNDAVPFSVLIVSTVTSDRTLLAISAFTFGPSIPVIAIWRTLAPLENARLRGTVAWLVPALSSAALSTFAALCLRNAPDADRLGLVTTSVPLRSFAFLALLLTGWITGLFLHVRAKEFGFSLPARFRVPRDPKPVPAGTPRPRQEPPPKARSPIELDP